MGPTVNLFVPTFYSVLISCDLYQAPLLHFHPEYIIGTSVREEDEVLSEVVAHGLYDLELPLAGEQFGSQFSHVELGGDVGRSVP